MKGMCHFEKQIWAIIPCPYLKNWTHNSVPLTRKVQSHKVKWHFVVNKDARFITLFEIHTYDDSKFSSLKMYTRNSIFIPCSQPYIETAVFKIEKSSFTSSSVLLMVNATIL